MIFRIIQSGEDKPKMKGIVNAGKFTNKGFSFDFWIKEINIIDELKEAFDQCEYPEIIFYSMPEDFNGLKIDGVINM